MTTDTPSTRAPTSLWSLVFPVLLLVGIPGLFGWFLLDHLDTVEFQDRRRQEQDGLLEVLGQIAQRGNLQQRFGSLFGRLSLQLWTLPSLTQRLSRLQTENTGVLDVYVFDPLGKRASLPGLPDQLVYASQQFLKAVLNPTEPPPEKLIRAFAGNGGVVDLLRASPGTMVELLNGGTRTYGGWYSLKNHQEAVIGHVIVFLHRQAMSPANLLNLAVLETGRLVSERSLIGWQDPMHPDVLQPRGVSFPAGLADHLASLPPGEVISEWKGRTLAVFMTEEGERLFGCAAAPLMLSEATGKRRSYFLVFLGVGFLFVLKGLYGLQGLRSKLVWLFAIAGGFPLAVFLSTVAIDRQDRDELLERTLRDRNLEFLTRFDAGARSEFLPALRSYRRFFQKTRRAPEALVPDAADGLHQEIQEQQGLITHCTVVNRAGRVLFFHAYDGAKPQGIRKLVAQEGLPHVALNILQLVNQDPPGSSTKALANPLISLVVATKYAPDWLDEDGLLKENRVGREELLTYFKLYPGENGSSRAIFLATHDSRGGQINYVRRYLGRRTSWKRHATRLYAVPVVAGGRWPTFIEKRFARDPMIRKMRDLVLTGGIPQHQALWLNGRKFLVSALRGHSLDGYVLMLARPYSALHVHTRRLASRGWMIAGSVLLLVMGIAWATARGLLQPLQELDAGLLALKHRHFEHVVTPGRLTELAVVAQRFNTILAGLKDLEMARSVQETLWPAQGLSGPGWSIQGRCVTASELGGDYYDWFVLADGRLVLAVGDVAGHGIPSSLVAASAKMELAMNAEMEADPAAVLRAMNAGLLTQAGRKRPMSFWLGMFDPVTRILRYANAGHNFPIYLASGEPPKLVEGPGYPLGSRKKASFVGESLDLSRGGRLLVYSDGIVEAHAPDGEPFDYDRLTALARELEQSSGEAVIADVFLRVQTWSRRSVPEDDQTLVILDIREVPA